MTEQEKHEFAQKVRKHLKENPPKTFDEVLEDELNRILSELEDIANAVSRCSKVDCEMEFDDAITTLCMALDKVETYNGGER